MLRLLVTVWLRVMLPCFNVAPDTTGDRPCGPGDIPLVDLDSLYLDGFPANQGRRRLAAVSVRGLECQAVMVPVEIDTLASSWGVMAWTQDTSGNPACEFFRCIGCLPPTVGVPSPAPSQPPRVEWYDVAGRRLLERPRSTGIYVMRAVRGKAHADSLVFVSGGRVLRR